MLTILPDPPEPPKAKKKGKPKKDTRPYPDDAVFLVGAGSLTNGEAFQGIRFVDRIDQPFGLLVVLPDAKVDRLIADLIKVGRLAVPVAVFGNRRTFRSDFKASEFGPLKLREALEATQTIRDRLNALPPVPPGPDAKPLSVFALALSRDTSITARIDPNVPDGVAYPLVDGIDETRTMLEGLAELGTLERHFFDRLHICGQCRSARLFVREVCTKCGGSHIEERPVVHHYRCGHQAPREDFVDDGHLTCPKCSRVLRHYGVDYDTPTDMFVCLECDEQFPEPDVSFRCGDCGGKTRAIDAATLDWNEYDLAPAALDALSNGRMPGPGWETILAGVSGRRSPRDLAMMIEFAKRLKSRYQRPFALISLNYLLPEDVLIRIGFAGQPRVQAMIFDVVQQTLRETDLVTTDGATLLLFLPETPPESVERVRVRLNERISDALGEQFAIRAELIGENEVESVIQRLMVL